MENCSNGSNCTGTSGEQGSPGVLEAFGILTIALAGLVFVLIVPTVVAVCMAQSIPKGLKAYLLSTLVSGMLINTIGILASLIACVKAFSSAPLPSLDLCRFILWAYYSTTTARGFSVVGYSVMVLIVVRYGKNVKTLYVILSLGVMWGLALLLNAEFLVPRVFAVGYVAGAVCLPVLDDTIILEARLFSTALWLSLASVLPLIVCVIVPLVVLCYLRKHAFVGNVDYGKAAAKLGLFLITGSLISSLGVIVNSVLLVLSVGEEVVIFAVYLTIAFSLYPTPIVINLFLKPVRDKLKSFLKCSCLSSCKFGRKTAARSSYELQEQLSDSLIIHQQSAAE